MINNIPYYSAEHNQRSLKPKFARNEARGKFPIETGRDVYYARNKVLIDDDNLWARQGGRPKEDRKGSVFAEKFERR